MGDALGAPVEFDRLDRIRERLGPQGLTELVGWHGLPPRWAPGTTCLTALRAGGNGTPASPINNSKGCDGVMRVAPVGLVFPPARAFDIAAPLGLPAGGLARGPDRRPVWRRGAT